MGGIISGRKPKFDPDVLDIQHFSQERCIGAGGFGKVHACFKLSLPDKKKLYAMKTLDKKHIFNNANGVSEVLEEMRLLSELRHPFICNIYYAFQDPWNCYLVMDLAKGGDLRYRMNQWKQKRMEVFPEDQIKFFVTNLILGLKFLNESNVLHRDMKPENYILEESGYVLLTDFGVAEHLSEDKVCSISSGTHGYMPPEMYDSSKKHTFTADYFAFGVSIYELLTGSRPFTADFIKSKSLSYDASANVPEPSSTPEELRSLKLGNFSEPCQNFVKALLVFNPHHRLGAKNQIKDLIDHEFFADTDWESISAKKATPPFIPDCSVANCDSAELDMAEMFAQDEKPPPPEESLQVQLKDYHYSWLGRNDQGSIATLEHAPDKSFVARKEG